MVDLHNHILPGIDDGAKDVYESLALLEKQMQDGVTNIALTPHFNFELHTLDEFLANRQAAFHMLQSGMDSRFRGIQLKLGAEVKFSTKLLETDPRPLCLEGTNYLLVEFSPSHYPRWAPDVFYNLQLAGIVPLVAHVERYPFVMQDFSVLYDWVSSGAVTQVNATSITKNAKRRKMIYLMMKHRLVHMVATDAHSMQKRPPCLKEAYSHVRGKMGDDFADMMLSAAQDVFDGIPIEFEDPSEVRKILGFMV